MTRPQRRPRVGGVGGVRAREHGRGVMNVVPQARVVRVADMRRSPEQVVVALEDRGTDVISVHDWGFLRGMGVFESMRWERGKMPFLRAHLTRLVQSCQRLRFEHPSIDVLAKYTREWTSRVYDETLAGGEPRCAMRVRVVVTAGPAGTDRGGSVDGHVVWMLEDLPSVQELVDEPINVVTMTGLRFCTVRGRGPGMKTLNYLSATMADRDAASDGAQEPVAVTNAGEVLEGSRSNVCVVRGRTLLTPPIEVGILAGVARAFVMQQWAALGHEVRQQVLHPRDLYEADEVLLTNSVRGVRLVGAVDGWQLRGCMTGTPSAGVILQRCWSNQWDTE